VIYATHFSATPLIKTMYRVYQLFTHTSLQKSVVAPLKINIFEQFKKQSIDFQGSYGRFSGTGVQNFVLHFVTT